MFSTMVDCFSLFPSFIPLLLPRVSSLTHSTADTALPPTAEPSQKIDQRYQGSNRAGKIQPAPNFSYTFITTYLYTTNIKCCSAMKFGGHVMASILAAACGRSVLAFVPSSSRLVAKQLNSATIKSVSGARFQSVASVSSASTRLFSAVVEKDATAAEEEEEDLPTNESDIDLLKLRHTSAHVMAMAVQETFPEAQVTIGPWIDNGFYYDFYFPETTDEETGEVVPSRKLSEADLKLVKKAMDKIISKDYPIIREEVSREEARKRIEAIGEPFKLEILDSIKTEPITIYSIGEEWWDLCAGPHVESTGQLPKKAIALQSVAGAYWRGDEKREMLQRIYATAWKDPQQLKTYKKRMEEAKKRDHRLLGKKLDLFSIQVSMFS
jgi:threonyl-tRNA synthetase